MRHQVTASLMACALALLAQLFAVQLETVAGDLETALVQASGAAIAGRILFVITLIFETMAVGATTLPPETERNVH